MFGLKSIKIIKRMKLKTLAITASMVIAMTACGNKETANNATPTSDPTPKQEATAGQQTAESAVIIATDGEITPDKTLPKVIDFNATWCGPCRRFAPIFHEVAQEYQGKAIFISVDVDDCPTTAQQFEVQSIPQVTMILPDGSVNSAVGYMEKSQFIEFLSKGVK